MNLTSTKKIETNVVEIEVAVGAEEFKAAVDRAFKKAAPKISLPGFRKGKAPRALIEKMYGEGFLFEDAVNELYPVAYEQAIKEAKLEPVTHPEIEITDVSKDGFGFKAKVTVRPEVEVTDYKGIQAEKVVYTASDDEVEAEINRLRERNGRIVNVEGRAAQNGDISIIDFEGFVDGVAFEGGKGENYSLTLGSGQFIPGFEEQIVGKEVGAEFDVNVNFPEEYHAEELKGKPAVFKVKINELKTKELPELDDEFAKDVSEFDTLADLKADTKKKIQERLDAKSQEDLENKLVDAVVANMKAEIPQVMIENRIDDMIRDFEYRLQSQGLNVDTYLQYTGMDKDGFRKNFAEQAEKQVKIRLALEKITELENLTATEDELNAEIDKIAQAYGLEADKVRGMVPENEISKDIAVNKAIDLIKEHAKVTESAEKAEEPKAKKTTKAKAADSEEKPKKTTRKTTKKAADSEQDQD